MAKIDIEDTYYKEIMTEPGFPMLDEDDLALAKDDVLDLFIWPAMREYFRWFPVMEPESVSIGTTFEIDFPRTETFGVCDARINTKPQSSGFISNPFIAERYVTKGVSKYGTPYDYDFAQVRITEQFARQSTVDMNRAFRVRVDENNRKLVGYSNIGGQMSVVWADYATDFAKVAFRRLDEVIKLARSNVLRHLGMLRNQQNTDMPNQLDGTEFINRADDLQEEVMNRWRAMSKVVLLRG